MIRQNTYIYEQIHLKRFSDGNPFNAFKVNEDVSELEFVYVGHGFR